MYPSIRPVPESAFDVAIPWIVRLRYCMAAGQFATVLIASQFFGIELPITVLAIVPVMIVLSNLWLLHQHNRHSIFSIFILDVLGLTAQLWLVGGATNPFSLMYLVHITLAATILTNEQTWLLGLLSTLSFAVVFWTYRPIPVLESHHTSNGPDLHLIGMWASFAVAAFLIAMFSARISELLREREASLLAMQEELAKKDRLASLVTLAAGAAHELGTPLGTIAVVARELERYANQADLVPAIAEDSRLIRTEVDRCREILERLSTEGAEPAGEALIAVRVSDLIATIRNYFATSTVLQIDNSNATLWPTVVIPRHAIEQALIALVKNAIEASPEGSLVTLHVAPSAQFVRFIVTDRGHGMSAETLRHVGEPFFTTKPTGKGMGLGTFLVRTLAERLGGSLQFDSAPHSGTTATFELPVPAAKPAVKIPA